MEELERSDNLQETVELRTIETHEDEDPNLTPPSVSSEEYGVTAHRRTSIICPQDGDVTAAGGTGDTAGGGTAAGGGGGGKTNPPGPWRRIKKFWTHNVVLIVPEKGNRDYLALERTFLAYIRTSVMLAMQGVTIAQLFRLQRESSHSNSRIGFYEIGVPLSTSYHGVALLVALLGAYRFWRQQGAMASGKVYSGGWELNCTAILLSLVVLATFISTVAVLIEIDVHGH